MCLLHLAAAMASAADSSTSKMSFKLEAKEEYTFSDQLQRVLASVIGSKDPLDQPDFNPVDYINALFPDEKSLEKIDEEVAKIKRKIYRIDNEIIESVSKQSRAGAKGKAELDKAKASVKELVDKIADIKRKADESERMVQDICRDIRDLDFAKKNLSATILSLRRLHTIVTGLDQLAVLALKKQYKEVGNLLTSVGELLGLFAEYKSIPKINEMNTKLNEFKAAIKQQVFSEFEFLGDPKQLSPDTLATLGAACFTIDALGLETRREFINFFVTRQLSAYHREFKEGTELAALEHTEKRYSWLMSWLRAYDQVFSQVFPPGWRVNEYLTEEFCFQTREKLIETMEATRQTLNVSALKRALKKTIMFEQELMKWFSRQSAPVRRGEEIQISPEMMRFKGMISVGFDAYMYLYIEKQETLMESMLQQVLTDEKWIIDEESTTKVLTSAMDMIFYFGQTRERMASLNQNEAFYKLFGLFDKFLDKYIDALKNKLAQLQPATLTTNDEMTCCLIVNTCEYCSNESMKIQKKFHEEINEKFKDKLDLQHLVDKCQVVVAQAVNLLIKHIESKLAPAFADMNKMNWETTESSGDMSKYVETIARVLQDKIPFYRKWMSSKYFPFLCDSFVGWFIPRFTQAIFDCRRISEMGAEQLIVDATHLKVMLEQLPVTGLSTGTTAPERYLKRVRREMEEVEKLIKLLRTPVEALVDFYKSLFPETHSDKVLARILQLKNVKHAEQEQIFQAYGSARNNVVLGGVREKLDSILGDLPDFDETAQTIRKFFNLQ